MFEDSGFDSDHKGSDIDRSLKLDHTMNDCELSGFDFPTSRLEKLKESEISINSLTSPSFESVPQPLYVQSGLHKKLERKLRSKLIEDPYKISNKDATVTKLIPYEKLATPNSSHYESQPLVMWNSDSEEESLQAFNFSPKKFHRELTENFSIEDLTACDDFEDLDLSPPKPLSSRYTCCSLVLEKPKCNIS